MSISAIEWTDVTWNPITGCTKVSPGCKNCYAERMSKRLKLMGIKKYENEFDLTLHPQTLGEPLRYKKPHMIFVNSMSDTFHEDVPVIFIGDIFSIMEKAKEQTFQMLTKRAERLLELDPQIVWPGNVWMGVSVENKDYTYRIDLLRRTHAHVKFLSLEPLLGPLHNLNLEGIDWVIVGGESGPKARPVKEEWITDIRDQCIKKNIPFFFKQWGGISKWRTGRRLEGRIWDQMPR
ncbi:MAG: phage Gp37/Gp68 family protein [Bacteroidales bacterium]|nr:phage Gp37/Gp68 family protein [Bacteroidales bacterium]